MHKRFLPIAVLVIFVAGAGLAAAQPAPPALTASAQALVRYLPTAQDLPAGFSPGTPQEVSNEDIPGAPGGADMAPVVLASRRITEVGFTARGTVAVPQIGAWVGAFADAEGAWTYIQDYTLPYFLPPVQRTVPGPDVGQRSAVYRYTLGSGGAALETILLMFQRDRLEVEVILRAPASSASVEQILPLARAIDAKIQASPPGPPTEGDLALIERPSPTVLVRGAVKLFQTYFIDELDADLLFNEAWEGAARALRAAGVANLPPAPSYPSDADAATAVHMQTFPMLETLARGRLTDEQLAHAAIREIVARRDDCHTVFRTPAQWQADKISATGGAQVLIGFGSAKAGRDEPMRIVSITPGSPARAAGMRRGQEILSINGTAVAGLSAQEANDLVRRGEGELNTFVVRNPSGSTQTIMVAPSSFVVPPAETEIVGNIGIIRFYRFEVATQQVEIIRRALEDFERRGVEGWVVDVRGNPGGNAGTLNAITSLFIEGGRIYGDISRGSQPTFTNASGMALPFQRPLVVLTDGGSGSAAEIMAGALQARGRAILVGQKTAGCIGGFFIGTGLLDGSVIRITTQETVLGPHAVRYHRLGVPPNVEVPNPTPLEDERGIDPQVEAALRVLREILGSPATQVPQPEPPKKAAAVFSEH